MSNKSIDQLPAANTIDGSADLLPIYTSSLTATQSISRNTYLGLSSAPAGLTDSQTLTNKVLTSPTINSATLSGTLSGTYTIGGTPTFPSSVVTLTGSQTLTNKVLTSPTVNSPTITNATISADTLTGYTVSNNGTVYGISVTGGTIGSAALAANSVTTAAINNAAVTPSKLATGAAVASVTAASTTASTSYVTALADAATISVTVSIGANGLAFISLLANALNSGANATLATYSASGANTIAAADANILGFANGTAEIGIGGGKLLTGLSAGSTTFTMNYRVSAGTGTYERRSLTVIPL